MATISTPLLKDRTYSSFVVTDLFHGGTTFSQFGKVNSLVAESGTFDTVTVNNLIVNGTVSGSDSVVDLGLSPSQLVATNATSLPVSFPYGTAANEIAIRDSNGSISFASWTTPETSLTQLSLATSSSTALSIDFNSANDSVVTLPDVGADANVVVYSVGTATKNVLTGDNILHLRGSTAGVILNTNNVGASRESFELGAAGQVKARLMTEIDTKDLVLVDVNDVEHMRITSFGDAQSNISFYNAICPMTSGWGLSNVNFASFSGLHLAPTLITSPNFTDSIDSNTYLTVITLNSSSTDSIDPMEFKDATFTNTLITATSKFIITVDSDDGTLNTLGASMPYVYVKSAGVGTCVLRTQNITSSTVTGFALNVSTKVVVLILP